VTTVRLDASNLGEYSRGCALLGAGGGGDFDVGLLMALHAVREHGPVEVVGLDSLPDASRVMPCGIAGSPAIANERIWSGDEGRRLLAAVEPRGRGGIVALMCLQIAGAGGVLPVTWAARLGLPLVDADARGRAFPRLLQQAMHLARIHAGPLVLTDSRSTVVVEAADDPWVDRLARGVASALGGVCAIALGSITVAQARAAVISGTVSHAIAVGRARSERGAREALGAVVLVEGRVVDLERRGERGSATVQTEGTGTRQLRLEFQSDYLIAIDDGAVCASVPDVICVLSAGTGDPLAIERTRFGDRVVVIAWPGHELWRSADGLSLAGPAAFGYDVDHVPLPYARS
jgi:DUF917 family protein